MTGEQHLEGPLHRASEMLMIAGIIVAGASFLSVFLPVDLGVFPRFEPTIIAVHAGSALALAGLLFAMIAGNHRILAAIRHPVVVLLIGIAVWSAAVAPATLYPLLSFAGAPQIGEGILMYGNMAVLVVVLQVLKQKRVVRYGVVALVVSVAWIGAAGSADPATRPLVFNDHLAFLGLGVFAICGAVLPTVRIRLSTSIKLALNGAVFGAVAAIPVLYVSHNKSAILIAATLGLPAYLFSWVLMRRAKSVAYRRRLRWASAALVIMLPIAITLSVQLMGAIGPGESVRARALIYEVTASQLADRPVSLIVGHGWGHDAEFFTRHLTAADATFWDRSWDMIERSYFHTHNFLLEALFAAGIPALLATLAILAAIPLLAPARQFPTAFTFALVLGGVQSVWFQLPGSFPFVALAIGALVVRPRRARPAGFIKYSALTAGSFLLMAQVIAIVWLTNYALSVASALAASSPSVDLIRDRATEKHQSKATCGVLPSDAWRGDLGLRVAFTRMFKPQTRSLRGGAVPDARSLSQLESLACQAEARAMAGKSVMLISSTVLFRNELAFTPAFAKLVPLFEKIQRTSYARLVRLIDIAPGRADLALIYLNGRVAAKDFDPIGSLSQVILNRRPDDPVGLWFRGTTLIESPLSSEKRRGLLMMDRALDKGLVRLMPLDSRIQESVRDGARRWRVRQVN